jgi:hypothetical protein
MRVILDWMSAAMSAGLARLKGASSECDEVALEMECSLRQTRDLSAHAILLHH